MKYRIKKETKPTLPTYGKYKAVAVHYQTVESRQIVKEAAQRMGTHPSNVRGVLLSLAEVINNHLREGDRVRLEDWGMMKLEIESEKVDNLKDFKAKKLRERQKWMINAISETSLVKANISNKTSNIVFLMR